MRVDGGNDETTRRVTSTLLVWGGSQVDLIASPKS